MTPNQGHKPYFHRRATGMRGIQLPGTRSRLAREVGASRVVSPFSTRSWRFVLQMAACSAERDRLDSRLEQEVAAYAGSAG